MIKNIQSVQLPISQTIVLSLNINKNPLLIKNNLPLWEPNTQLSYLASIEMSKEMQIEEEMFWK